MEDLSDAGSIPASSIPCDAHAVPYADACERSSLQLRLLFLYLFISEKILYCDNTIKDFLCLLEMNLKALYMMFYPYYHI